MTIQIRIPQMGESITEGVIARWLKAEGDAVAVDEPVVEVETDKITVEVPAPSAGVLARQSVAEGTTVGVGQTIGEIDETATAKAGNGKPASAPAPKPASAPAPPKPATAPPKGSAGSGPVAHEGEIKGGAPPPSDEPVAAGPSARLEAARSGVDLASVSGSGRGGRIQKEDVVKAQAPAPVRAPATPTPTPAPAARPARAPGEREERKAMSPLRRRVAQRLVESQNTAAILTTFNEVDMGEVMALRGRYKESFEKRHGVKLGFMSFFVKAAIEALKEFPPVNAEIDGEDVVYHYHYDIGVAVGGGKGLVVPVLRDADSMTFAQVEQSIAAYADKAKNNKLSLEDLSGGTFTISNGGIYGSMMSTPIINPPQTGILGLHNIVERPVAIAGKVEIRPIMYVALSYDHRLIDGREAVQFLVRIKQCIERPERLLLEV
ncbi:MAG TPA: 2-oxoglutarate dehydrogenase complex dihydrolipoyllysine-residue succinyltransferase [Nannocystaceae bacterium]|nr:2-oxoglutarate dehydrogenase complex dihydrolipoyllysine-residue succinyltransferase [Nannocystaceae bacterium]